MRVQGHPAHTPATARPVVEAVAAVIGTPIAQVLQNPHVNRAEVHAIRIAAAVALVEQGWTKDAAARATCCRRGSLSDGRWPVYVHRAKVNMPRLYEAAKRAAEALPSLAASETEKATEARIVVAAACRRYGIDADRFHSRMNRQSILARRAVIDELAGRGWSTLAIERHTKISESTVHYWRKHRTSSRPSMARSRAADIAATP